MHLSIQKTMKNQKKTKKLNIETKIFNLGLEQFRKINPKAYDIYRKAQQFKLKYSASRRKYLYHYKSVLSKRDFSEFVSKTLNYNNIVYRAFERILTNPKLSHKIPPKRSKKTQMQVYNNQINQYKLFKRQLKKETPLIIEGKPIKKWEFQFTANQLVNKLEQIYASAQDTQTPFEDLSQFKEWAQGHLTATPERRYLTTTQLSKEPLSFTQQEEVINQLASHAYRKWKRTK